MLEMNTTQKIMTLVLMLVISSCNKHFINCDISLEFNRCRCRCLNTETLKEADAKECEKDWDKYFYGTPTNHPENYELLKCEGLHGFFDRDVFDEIIPAIKEERQRCDDKSTEALHI